MNVAGIKSGVHIAKLLIAYAEVRRNGKRRVAGFYGVILFALDFRIEQRFEFRSRHNGRGRINAVNKRYFLHELHF